MIGLHAFQHKVSAYIYIYIYILMCCKSCILVILTKKQGEKKEKINKKNLNDLVVSSVPTSIGASDKMFIIKNKGFTMNI